MSLTIIIAIIVVILIVIIFAIWHMSGSSAPSQPVNNYGSAATSYGTSSYATSPSTSTQYTPASTQYTPASTPAPVQTSAPSVNPGLYLYKDKNYGGASAYFPPGKSVVRDVNGALSNTASSLKVTNGCQATVFDKDNYGGRSLVYNGYVEVPTLGGTGLDDNIASVMVTCS